MQKVVLASTSERCVEHLFAGQNTQQQYFVTMVNRVLIQLAKEQ